MKKIFIQVMLLAISLYMTGQTISRPCPEWLKSACFYQLYPQSFKDSNGDGIGDIRGIIQKLDYIKWLGCNAIWINPCFESAFQDAGYDVIDFYKVAPRYGTNADLKELFVAAHKKGIRICLDLVAGHTSDQHPWFLASQIKENNVYSDRYIWTRDSTIKPVKYVSGKFERNGTYRKNFFDCQPALNYGFARPDSTHPWEQPVTAPGPQSTRRELMTIMDYWMDMGADGFRVDMAPSLIKNDPDQTETNRLWHEIRNHFQKKYPQGILIAEWGNPAKAIKAGFMMDFIIHLGNNGYSSLFFNKTGTYVHDTCYFSLDGNGTPSIFADYYTKTLQVVKDSGFLCVPTSNHDFQRPACGSRKDDEQLKVAMVFFLTLKSIPMIYYGDEIGMRFIPGLPNKEGSELRPGRNRAGTRTPMQWDPLPGAGFSSAGISDFYLPLDPDSLRPDVLSQQSNPSSMLCFTKKLLEIRKIHPALTQNGDFEFLYALPNAYPLIYKRSYGKDVYLIVLNPSARQQSVVLDTISGFSGAIPVLSHQVNVYFQNGKIRILAGACTYAIFKLS